MNKFNWFWLVCGAVAFQCSENQEQPKKLFSLIEPNDHQVKFENIVQETDDFNLFTWKYIYNGGGVAAGDINNDGLIDLYFSANQGANKLFLNQGNFQFEDITETAGVSAPDGYKTGVAMVDLNGDGWMDLFVCRDASSVPELRMNHAFINQKDGTFLDQATALGLTDQSYSTQALFFDFDRDNDLDIFLLNHPSDFDISLQSRTIKDKSGEIKRITSPDHPDFGNRLYRNEGNKFVEITAESGLSFQGFGLSALAIDINEDGWQDLFIANDFLEPDLIYINQQNGTFLEKGKEILSVMAQNSMGSFFQDITGDDLPELIVVDMLAESNYRQKIFATSMWYERFERWRQQGYGAQIMRNMVYLNRGNGQFSEIGQLAGMDKSDWSWSVLAQDFTGDGNKEVLITNGILRDMSNSDFIAFYADSLMKVQQKGLEGFYKKDFEQLLNKIPSTPLMNHFYSRTGHLQFENIASTSGLEQLTFSQGAIYADLDNDLDLDLVINNTNQPAMIYQNNTESVTKHHFIVISLRSAFANGYGVGSKITLIQDGKTQSQWLQPFSGYLSSQSYDLTFGLGNSNSTVDAIITWADGNIQKIENLATNQKHTIFYEKSKGEPTKNESKEIWVSQLTQYQIYQKHHQSEFVDFKREPLLPWMESKRGPILATGDVNGDGLTDVFIGGSAGYQASILIQKENESFASIKQPEFDKSAIYEDIDAVFSDINRDGFPDLIVVSGGNEHLKPENYLNRIYLNDGKGIFRLHQEIDLSMSAGTVAVADLNGDDQPDLFIGGRQIPGQYGKTVPSYFLLNEKGNFRPVQKIEPQGLISDAEFADINNDGMIDLVITGHWMAPQIWMNTGAGFTKAENTHLDAYTGWWNTLQVRDINRDGLPDIIMGNMGENLTIKPNRNAPAKLFVADFDGNGTEEGLFTFFTNNDDYPLARYETISKWFPFIKKQFNNFDAYAKAPIRQLFPTTILSKANVLEVTTSLSGAFINRNGVFEFVAFPAEAQIAPIYSFVVNQTKSEWDFLLAGNFYEMNIEFAPATAGKGLLLNFHDGNFNIVPCQFEQLTGNIRSIVEIDNKKLLLGSNNDSLKIIQIQKTQNP